MRYYQKRILAVEVQIKILHEQNRKCLYLPKLGMMMVSRRAT